ncbi:MAG: flagellar motor switch protein FliG [Marivivens sp.]|uniref:FliG C-terminal domain-containing protein n=1 Tax=Marivivens sp. TaxID=1978374 RepID=UPI00179E543B|nr:FliG C-terminal domain-containing protein [Marivivens sp.]NVJ96418.1 flagellar motor switch protein FliG [Marivivens sp.]
MPDGSHLPPIAHLTRRQKAALLVQYLMADGQTLNLSEMPEDAQIALTREIADIGMVDRATVDHVVIEFLDEMDRLGLTGPGGISAALDALSGQLSAGTTARLNDELSCTDPWRQICKLEVDQIVPLVNAEAIEVCAITLSKLPVDKAAQVLGRIAGERARRITYTMSLTTGVAPETVLRIGTALIGDYGKPRETAFAQPAPRHLGAILTASGADLRDSLLSDLHDDDPVFTAQVRQAIFTFADIPARLPPPDVPKVLRAADQADVVTALAHAMAMGGALEAGAEYLLANLSQRVADQIKDEMAERGTPRKAEGEAAQTRMTAVIQKLAETGEITLFSTGEDAA